MTHRDLHTKLTVALQSADPRVLAALVTHLSGDSTLVGSDMEESALRAVAVEVLTPFCTREKQASPPSDEVLQAAMDLCAGQTVPPEYGPMMRDQAGLGPPLQAVMCIDPPPGFHVVIIGAGLSGLCAAMALDKAGVEFTIIDKNDHLGGTWFENTFPGCGVDTPSHLYSYSFAQNPGWSRYFSLRDEVLAYIEDIAARHRLERRIRFGRTVDTLRWDEEGGVWRITSRLADGTLEQIEAPFVVSAVGVLNQPKIPPFPGLESFAGPAFHSARWNHDFDPAGKRVAVIGSGASANQIVPELSQVAEHVTVVQRSPHWMMAVPEAFQVFDDGARWLFEHVPFYAQWFRFMLLWVFGDTVYAQLRIDPDWPHPERSANAENDQWREKLTAYIRSEVSDPDLLDKLIPNYPPWGKRMLIDHGWYKALQKDNVSLVAEPIERITKDGIVTKAGHHAHHAHHAVDAIVLATGFYPDRCLYPMTISGRDGQPLHERWGDNPQGYLGVAILDCPNFFTIYGPNSNVAHGGSAIFIAECQVHYIMRCMQAMFERGWSQIEVERLAHDAYNEAVEAELVHYVWTHPAMDSWYKNSQGKVTTNLPWRLIDYWLRSREPNMSHFQGK